MKPPPIQNATYQEVPKVVAHPHEIQQMHRVRTIASSSAWVSLDAGTVSYGVPVSVHSLRFSLSSRRGRERVLFIGTQFSILYTSMYSPAEAATPRAWCLWFRESMYTGVHRFLTAAVCQQLLVRVMPAQTPLRQQRIISTDQGRYPKSS